MPFPPPRNHKIPLAAAVAMTKRYRASVKPGAFRAGLFPCKEFEDLMAQKGCAGIRIYLGCHEDDALSLIMVGVNAEGQDMVAGVAGLTENEGGEVVQDSIPCPPFCNDGSPLNGG